MATATKRNSARRTTAATVSLDDGKNAGGAWTLASAESAVASNPGPNPPYQALTVTASKNRANPHCPTRGASRFVATSATTLAKTATR